MLRTIFVFHFIAFLCYAIGSCSYFTSNDTLVESDSDSVVIIEPLPGEIANDTTIFDPVIVRNDADKSADTVEEVSPEQLLAYAKTLIGTTYKYASIDPAEGLDCSGFITHVFNHFSIQVPRSSIDFTNYGINISTVEAKPGDLILFTGTDTLVEVVGHMGIVSAVGDELLEFIHSTSGKAFGVTITTLNEHYRKRFVKVIRIPYIPTADL
ncbi:C40 family peptidase [Lacibacter sp. H407]|uniref:C40 family peptidase n=1 Tax=Lacibacter sp. H407 TaxID=3133423 RepID=UPI0030C32891